MELDISTLVLGRRQTGKTQFCIGHALDKIYKGESVVFFDSNGSAIDELLTLIPNSREKHVLYINPSQFPFPMNPLYRAENHSLVTTTLYSTIYGLWFERGTSTPNVQKFIKATIRTLLSVPGATLINWLLFFTDTSYRNKRTGHSKDKVIAYFWTKFNALSPKDQRAVADSTENKIWSFVLDPFIRHCIGQVVNKLVFENKIVLVSLKNSDLGQENAKLLGALMLAQLYIERPNTTLFIDGDFGTAILAMILKDTDIVTVLTAQSLDHFSDEFRPIVLSSIGQILAFRSSLGDARTLKDEFNVKDGETDLHELQPTEAYLAYNGFREEHKIKLHSYQKPKKPRNTKKPVERRITDRCVKLSPSREDIEEKIGRFFA